MKRSFELIIYQPLDIVWQAFSDPSYLKFWQPRLKDYRHQSGEVGSPGAKSQLQYMELGQIISMTETILENKPMSEFAALYTGRFGESKMRHLFRSQPDRATNWSIDVQFIWQGLVGKLMGRFAEETMQKRFYEDFQNFKLFVESYQWKP
ncbi:MAG: SRPBCC family protein [Oligoflexus sp.]